MLQRGLGCTSGNHVAGHTNSTPARPSTTGGSPAFGHRSSRAGDFQLHTHLAVVNAVLDADGRSSALEARLLYHHARTRIGCGCRERAVDLESGLGGAASAARRLIAAELLGAGFYVVVEVRHRHHAPRPRQRAGRRHGLSFCGDRDQGQHLGSAITRSMTAGHSSNAWRLPGALPRSNQA